MADDEDDIVWIREDTEGSPTTPATIIEVAPVLSDAFEPRGPPEVTISAPPPTPPALALITIELTEAPPTKQEATPTEAPPTEAPPPETQAPPPEAPPPTVEAPPTNGQAPPPQVEAPPTEAPPTQAPPTEAPPTQAPPTEAPPPTTQDQLSAKLDPKTPNSVDDNSLTFDLSECERNFNKAIREASDILEDFDEKSKQVAENTKFVARELAELAVSAPRVFQKTIDDKSQVPEISELPSGGLPKNVESVLIGEGVLEEITGTLVLPNGLVLVTDERAGIFLFDLEGNIKAKINPPEFRKLWSPVYHKEHILVLADAKNGDDHWVRHVIKFTFQLEYVAKIECPSWLAECTILRERLSIAHNDHLYLCVCGEIFSGLYELTPVGQWTELEYKLSEAYVDMLAFATIGPITQLLVVEGRRNYVLLVSIRESRVVDKKRMAICERPGALARDEAGRLFVANRFSASIQLVDTMRWVSDKNVAITEAFVRHFSACWGLLAIPLKTAVRLQRYSFRSLR
uniref:CNH domain-containing protein n=1 Tax=Caenorhabditis tropicalis TaxID=1561998 RepID=A0A1I7TPP8_9PELO